MKRAICPALAVTLFLLLAFLPGTARAAAPESAALFADEELFKVLDPPHADGSITITGYSGYEEVLNIPPAINGKPVTAIQKISSNSLRELILPEGLIALAPNAFQGCPALQKVYIPSTLLRVGKWSASASVVSSSPSPFAACASLTEITFGAGTTAIAANLFQNCPGLQNGIELPENVTIIRSGAFQNCVNLSSVTFHQKLREIESNAFSGCTALTSLDLPEGLSVLNSRSFADCTMLKQVHFPGTLLRVTGAPFDYGSSSNAPFAGSALETVTFGPGLSLIPPSLFQACASLKEVRVPDTVTEIGGDAFCASGLVSISLPDGLAKIGDDAFRASALESVEIPDSVTEYGAHPFYQCECLVSARLSVNALELPAEMFRQCYLLEHIELPQGVEEIPSRMFFQCYALTRVAMPDTVLYIRARAFQNCRKLVSIPLSKNLKSIGNYAFEDCEALPEINLPDTLSSLGEYAFQNNFALHSVTLPQPILTIPRYAFAECVALSEVVIPRNTTAIKDHAFYHCTALTRIFLPASITEIDQEISGTDSTKGQAFSYTEQMTVEGVPGSYAETWAAKNSCAFQARSIPCTGIRLATGLDEILVPPNTNVAPVFVLEPENTTDVLTLVSDDTDIVRVVNGNLLYGQSRSGASTAITVTATGGLSVRFPVRVQSLKGIEITRFPYKLRYALREAVELDGLAVSAVFGDGSRQLILNNPAIPASIKTFSFGADSDTSRTGEQTVTISCGSRTASFPIQVYGSPEEIPVSVGRVEARPGGAHVELCGAAGGGTLAVAACDANGRFLAAAYQDLSPADIERGSVEFALDTTGAVRLSAFLTDAGFRPLCPRRGAVL